MAEEQDVQQEAHEEQQPEEPHGTDWKSEARKWESRAKENKAKADRLDELEEKSKSELQKATEKAAKAESELKALKAERQRDGWAAEVSAKTGVPAHMLQGSTFEEMEAFAKDNAHYFRKDAVPAIGEPGRTPDAQEQAGGDPIRALFGK